MRKRFKYDADLDAVIEIRDGSNYYDEPTQSGPNVISDDVGAGVNGLRHMPSGVHSDSKSFHYKETRARGLEHVGNETNFAGKREHNTMSGEHVKTAMEQIAGNHNGTRDWLRWRERQ